MIRWLLSLLYRRRDHDANRGALRLLPGPLLPDAYPRNKRNGEIVKMPIAGPGVSCRR